MLRSPLFAHRTDNTGIICNVLLDGTADAVPAKTSPFFELALVLVRLDEASRNAQHFATDA